ncbi:MAG: protein kinase, partial [Chloroflexi bacterium]|nr:protein kinase [Chloroflexota bacterium]
MPSERVQRRIDELLDQAEDAIREFDWPRARATSLSILAADPDNDDAKTFLAMAAPHLGGDGAGVVEEPATTPGDGTDSDVPTSFANGRYEVKGMLGEGGKKKVYLVHDTILDRDVAFGLIKAEGLDDASRQRITREAQAMARLGDNPNIMPIFDLGEENGQPYMVGPLMGGGDVEALIEDAEDGRLSLEETLRITTEICRGLEFAHEKGIIHRDLKPGNVWLTDDGTVRIGDFGLAISLDRSRLTQEKMMVGTVGYMPPEQATGGEITPKADLYSLGAMLYEMVTGRPPFIGDDDIAIIGQHINTPPVAPSWHRKDCPRPLEALIMRLLAKDPAERPDSARDVLNAIDAIDLAARGDTVERESTSLESLAGGVFVGRQAEMDQLKAALEDVLGGRGRLVTLAGEPGIGKTRTSEELATYAGLRGAQVLWGRCYETGGQPPYWPWVQAIRSYVRETEPDELRRQMGSSASVIAEIVTDVKDRLPDLQPPPQMDDPDSARFRLFDSITSFLKTASQARPLVIVLDDLHWSDQPTLSLLEFMARELSQSRLMLVCTYRDMELNRRHPLTITLGDLSRERLYERVLLRGLSEHDVARFIEIAAGIQPPPELSATVHRHTEGNPLFVTEVVRELVQSGDIAKKRGSDDSSWSVRIPEGVREVIGRRLDRLSERANEMLTTAAVVGRDFRMDILSELSEDTSEGQLLDVLDEALDSKIIEELADAVGHYQFTHALMQETLTGELSITRRVRLHARIAEALEGIYGDEVDQHAPELAYHYSEAEAVLGTEKLVHFSIIAGEDALAANAPLAAITHFERAERTISDHSPDSVVARVERGVGIAGLAAARINTEYQAAWEAVARSFEMFVEIGDHDSAVKLVARSVYPVAAVSGTAVVLEKGFELAPKNSVEAGRILGRLFLALMQDEGEEERSGEFAEQALRIAELTSDTATEMLVRSGQAVIAGFRGENSESLSHSLRVLELAESGGDLQSEWYARYFSGASYLALGEQQQALVHIDGMLGLSERYGVSPLFAAGLRERRDLLLGEWETLRRPEDQDHAPDSIRSRFFDLNIAVADAHTGRDNSYDPLEYLLGRDPAEAIGSTALGALPNAAFIASMLPDTPHEAVMKQIARLRSLDPESMRHDTFLTLQKELAATTALIVQPDTPRDLAQLAYERLEPLKKSAYSIFSVDRLRGRLAIALDQPDDA